KAPGTGFLGRKLLTPSDKPIQFTLSPQVKIEGRLVTLEGAPVKGARVELENLGYQTRTEPPEGFFLLATTDPMGRRLALPDWPDPVWTDEQGRFTLPGLSSGGFA